MKQQYTFQIENIWDFRINQKESMSSHSHMPSAFYLISMVDHLIVTFRWDDFMIHCTSKNTCFECKISSNFLSVSKHRHMSSDVSFSYPCCLDIQWNMGKENLFAWFYNLIKFLCNYNLWIPKHTICTSWKLSKCHCLFSIK